MSKKGNPVPVHVRAMDKDGKLTQAMVRFMQDQQDNIKELSNKALPVIPEYDGVDKTYGIKVTAGGIEWVEI